jgi:hypothetical protein
VWAWADLKIRSEAPFEVAVAVSMAVSSAAGRRMDIILVPLMCQRCRRAGGQS